MAVSYKGTGEMDESVEKAPATDDHQTNHHQKNQSIPYKFNVPSFGVFKSSISDENGFPFLQITGAEKCRQTPFVTSSGANVGQNQQQSSDHCLLLSFIERARPPTVIVVNTGIRYSLNFLQQELLRDNSVRGPPAFFS